MCLTHAVNNHQGIEARPTLGVFRAQKPDLRGRLGRREPWLAGAALPSDDDGRTGVGDASARLAVKPSGVLDWRRIATRDGLLGLPKPELCARFLVVVGCCCCCCALAASSSAWDEATAGMDRGWDESAWASSKVEIGWMRGVSASPADDAPDDRECFRYDRRDAAEPADEAYPLRGPSPTRSESTCHRCSSLLAAAVRAGGRAILMVRNGPSATPHWSLWARP
jgi:hypothetical protein